MSRISLTACSFYFRRSYSKSNLNVYNLNGTVETFDKNQSLIRFQDIRQVFENFFNKFNISVNNDEKQKTFRCNYNPCDCGECDDFSYFYVTIQSGNYGSSFVLDVVTDIKIIDRSIGFIFTHMNPGIFSSVIFDLKVALLLMRYAHSFAIAFCVNSLRSFSSNSVP